jgi:hypothetical protein
MQNLGLGQLTYLIEAHKDLISVVERLYQANKQLYSPENVLAAAQLNAEWEVLTQQMKELAVVIAGPLIHAINAAIENAKGSDVYSLADQFRRTGTVGMGAELSNAPVDALTKALQANTDATIALKDGIYGGGRAAQTAIPGAFHNALGLGWDGLKHSTNRLGAFGLGS